MTKSVIDRCHDIIKLTYIHFIRQKINDAMDDRCLKLMMIIGGAGDGSSGDDPEAANTEPGRGLIITIIFRLAHLQIICETRTAIMNKIYNKII